MSSRASAESFLPQELLERASLRGNEYAWPIDLIPDVIDAARSANLMNIGGQLQFRIPEGGTCECYWIEIDTYKAVSKALPWNERVAKTALAAKIAFTRLREQHDFEAEGRSAFGEYLAEFEAKGGRLSDALCFVWYVKSEQLG